MSDEAEPGKVRVLFECVPDAKRPILVPTRATPGAAGYDIRSGETATVPPRGNRTFRTGLKVQCPPGWCLLGIPRSGLATKGVTFANCVGLIDSDYGGELHVLLANNSDTPFPVRQGDRIGQILVVPSFEIEFQEVPVGTIQGRGGLGSTGVR